VAWLNALREYSVPSTQYSVPSTRYAVLNSVLTIEYGHSVLGTEYWVLSTAYPVLSTAYPVLGTEYWALNTRYWVLNTEHSVLSTRLLPSPRCLTEQLFYPRALSFTEGSSATFTQTWTCGSPRKYQTNEGPSSRQLSHSPSLPMSPSL
jgi:hypothetical protein